MLNEPGESSIAATAAQQLKDLKILVDSLTRTRKRHRIELTVQGILLAVLAVLSGVLINVVIDQHQATVQACQAGNAFRAADERHWALFIQIALKGNTQPQAHAQGKELLDGISKSDQPRDCGS